MAEPDLDVGRLLHDLRNPLAAVYTAISVLMELPDETPLSAVRGQLRLAQSAVTKGSELIETAQDQLEDDSAD